MSVTCIKFTELSLLILCLTIYYQTFHVKMLEKKFVKQIIPLKIADGFEEDPLHRREAREVTSTISTQTTIYITTSRTVQQTNPANNVTTEKVHNITLVDYVYDMEGIMVFSGFFGGFILIVSAMLLGTVLGCPMDIVSETSYLLLGICLACAHFYRERMYQPYHDYAAKLYLNDINITISSFWSKWGGQPLSLILAIVFIIDMLVSLFLTTDLVAGQCPQ